MNKGKDLERKINRVLIDYRREKKAFILHSGTPVVITAQGARLEKGAPDYIGVMSGGKYIVFDAKECGNTTSFPLSYIKEHQYNFISAVAELGGIGFILVDFYKVNKVYKIPIEFITSARENDKSSISISELDEKWLVNMDNFLDL